MIVPNVRGSFGRSEASLVIGLLTRGDGEARVREEDRLREEGFDALLDDPRTLNVLLAGHGLSAAPARLVFYILVRHALLEGSIGDRSVADYMSTLLLEFGRGRRALRIDAGESAEYSYLSDLRAAAESADARAAFLARVHLGNYALWQSGLFPEHIAGRERRKGAPGLDYYEELGATGYRLAARCTDAEKHGLDGLYRTCADSFAGLRTALNRIADRYLFPSAGDPVDRLLRQVSDSFRETYRSN